MAPLCVIVLLMEIRPLILFIMTFLKKQLHQFYKNGIPLSDPLHLLKGARAKLVNYLIMINIEHLKYVNTQLFAESVRLGPVFTDRNSAGAMKDEYAVLLFSWYCLVESLRNCRYARIRCLNFTKNKEDYTYFIFSGLCFRGALTLLIVLLCLKVSFNLANAVLDESGKLEELCPVFKIVQPICVGFILFTFGSIGFITLKYSLLLTTTETNKVPKHAPKIPGLGI